MTCSLKAAPIDDALLQSIYECDQGLYPAPLSFDRLLSWRDAVPELSILCRTIGQDSTNVGAILVMPLLRNYWEELLIGKQKETEVEPSMFASAGSEGVEVGLHVFHVERFEGNGAIKGFTKLALELVQEFSRTKSWKIVGYSALTASDSGRAVFQRLGYEPTGYEEFFVTRSNGPAEMLCFGPHDEKPQSADLGLAVESRSLMVVRYGEIGY